MAVHFIHIGKTGGSAIKRALAQTLRRNPELQTPYGPIHIHRHAFGLADVPPGDFAFFCVRDPITRYLSGFYSRLRKGQPRYYFEWTPRERAAFDQFQTPQQLAAALGATGDDRAAAERAMRGIRHLRPMTRWLQNAKTISRQSKQIVYIGRQETLDSDWEQLRAVLGLSSAPPLPTDPVRAHRAGSDEDRVLDAAALATLRQWYAEDTKLIRTCERLRRRRGWAPPPEG